MEVSLSFDNAVLNASVLKDMPAIWQRRFLTWGMPIAVFGMRFAFPILIVSLAAWISIPDVIIMAIDSPDDYASHLQKSHVLIDAFGGVFLLMTFLSFHCNNEKEIHWLPWIEKPLSFVPENTSGFLVLLVIALMILFTPEHKDLTLGGLIAFWGYFFLDRMNLQKQSISSGIKGLLYLEVLDASCSFDGVIGAFVLTNNIFIIMAGLGIGALAIRSLTLHLVRGGILNNYRYLEHGAHYGIGALAIIMLTDIFYPVPEPITGMIGMSFIGLSLLSSILHNRRNYV